jgi:hypothetical protein
MVLPPPSKDLFTATFPEPVDESRCDAVKEPHPESGVVSKSNDKGPDERQENRRQKR